VGLAVKDRQRMLDDGVKEARRKEQRQWRQNIKKKEVRKTLR